MYGRVVSNKLDIDIDIDFEDAAESNFSERSRSFMQRVNDRLRNMLKRFPEVSMENIDKRIFIWRMLFFGSGSICIHVKELLRYSASHEKYRRSHNETDVPKYQNS